ncbi:MAG TPA: hypothetical protein VED01_23690 [Burkholderiales bacterium]|nr:hypothetical protein [Burkholderiales bacterium]
MMLASGSAMIRLATVHAIAVAIALAMAQSFTFAADAKNATPPAKDTGKATKADVAKADQDRKKPLQRCDQLKDKAQLECLEKARERIVEAREKREASGKDAASR